MAKKKLSGRAQRRQDERAAEKLADARERLALLEAGGVAARPLQVTSASQVEPHALALPCLRCDGAQRLDEHAAVTVNGERLRVARTTCARCGTPRETWYRIAPDLPS